MALPLLILALVVGSDRAELARFAAETPGDPARGRAVFEDAAFGPCSRCHRVRGAGGEIGPDLSDVGAKYDRAHLIEAVLAPSRQIVEGYRTELVALRDGRLLSGLVRGESAEALALIDAEGRRHAIAKAEIEERATTAASLMPEGLVDGLSPPRFADLIAYLQSLRSAEQPTPGSAVKGPIVVPPGFAVETVAAGLTGATALAAAPDGRVFVCEQTGTLRVVKRGRLLPDPFARLDVDSAWERGLIGVALPPDFSRTGSVYVHYVVPGPPPRHRVGRLVAGGDVAAGPVSVVFEGADETRWGGSVPAGHQGGAIHFGGDGRLYVAIGDQTAGTPAQSLDSLLGKLLRIEPDGRIPPDNPFAREARGPFRSIWARGLRNPFTFAVQPGGRIFINDVGGVFEEINEGRAGANYGWPVVEHGPTHDPRFVGPIHWYPTASISGGAFCPSSGPGAAFPAEYRGKYFFMDFVKGWIRVLDPDRPREATGFATGLPRPVDLAFAPDGSLDVLLRDAWVKDAQFRPGTGALVKIRFVGLGTR